MTSSTRAVARLSGPGEFAAAVPSLLGFTPTESLVLCALRGPRGRVGLVTRVDLPPPEGVDAVLAQVLDALCSAGAERVTGALFSEHDGDLPHEDLADAVCAAVRANGLPIEDLLLVRGGRWWSYLCGEALCCPADGTPVPDGGPGLGLLQAERVLAGRPLLADRQALVAGLAAPTGADAEAMAAVLLREAGAAADRARSLAGVRTLVQRGRPVLGPLPAASAARVALALGDVPVRDEVLRWLPTRGEELLALLHVVARQVPAPWDAGVCACLAGVAYCRGDGAVAVVALERALASDPEHGLARLLDVAIGGALHPEVVRQALSGVEPGRPRRLRRAR